VDRTRVATPIAWIAIYGAIIGVTSFVPLIPYIGGGGFLPLSISIAALSPLILGFGPGVVSALIGGIIGMFVSPASYPFGLVDVFFVALLPSVFCGFAFKGRSTGFRLAYITLMLISGVFAEIVPYYYPGPGGGFPTSPPQPLYFLLVSFFFLPWVLLYASPIGTRYIAAWIEGEDRRRQFLGGGLGILIGLMPWSIWMVTSAALILNYPPELAVAIWVFAIWSRAILTLISAIIFVPVVRLLERSGMPAPAGAVWQPKR